MMRQNRKKSRNEGFIFPGPFAGAMLLLLILGLAYVWVECRRQVLGQEIASLEGERAALEKTLGSEAYKWSQMRSLESVERALRRFGVAMVWPEDRQIMRLSESEVYGSGADMPGDRCGYARLERTTGRE
jgi:hypothetical protein